MTSSAEARARHLAVAPLRSDHAARREPVCPPRAAIGSEAPAHRPTQLDPAACNADQARGAPAPRHHQRQHEGQRQRCTGRCVARIFDASQVIFVDCDDCLYQNNWATAAKITTSIAAYTANLGVSEEKAYALYKTHGTCLKGMLAEGLIAADAAEDFLLRFTRSTTPTFCLTRRSPPCSADSPSRRGSSPLARR